MHVFILSAIITGDIFVIRLIDDYNYIFRVGPDVDPFEMGKTWFSDLIRKVLHPVHLATHCYDKNITLEDIEKEVSHTARIIDF